MNKKYIKNIIASSLIAGTLMLSGCDKKGIGTIEDRVNESNESVKVVHRIEAEKKENVNSNLYETIARHEGIRDTAYFDSKGILTIGAGFNLEKQGAKERIEKMGLNYELVCDKKQKLSKEHIFLLMKEDVETAISDAKKYVGEKWESLNPDAKEIIINMSYNLGYPRLSKFKKLKHALINRDYQTAAKEMKDSKWYYQVGNRSKELVKRMETIK